MVYDQGRDRIFLQGGCRSMTAGEDCAWASGNTTSQWNAGEVQGSHVFKAQLGTSLRRTEAYTIEEVTVRWYAGGLGHPVDEDITGATLYIWDDGIWQPVATNEASPEAPALVEWTTEDSAMLQTLFLGENKDLYMAVTPNAVSGAKTSTLTSDYVEVRVRYELSP